MNETKFGFNRADRIRKSILDQIGISTGPGQGLITQNYDSNSIHECNSFSGIGNRTWIMGGQPSSLEGRSGRI